jgi:SPP1 gp7 family putative phage head morphogenesis protein
MPAPSIRPNAGIEAAYRKRLLTMIEAMHKSMRYWMQVAYRKREAEIVGDAAIAKEIDDEFQRRSKYWRAYFADKSKPLAKWFIAQVNARNAYQVRDSFKKLMPTVDFDAARITTATMQAHIQESVSLIRTIPNVYLDEVEKMITRSIAAGRDLHDVTRQLEDRYSLTRYRASLIARDQNNKATGYVNRERQQAAGIEYGVWKHSHAGKVPRPSHKAADGKVFRLKDGMYLEDIGGKWAWILPGYAINCRCTWQALIPGVDYPVGGKPKGFRG